MRLGRGSGAGGWGEEAPGGAAGAWDSETCGESSSCRCRLDRRHVASGLHAATHSSDPQVE